MGKITYIHDHEQKYKEDILKTIQAYNKSQTGVRKTDSYSIYVFQDKQLVGGLHTEQFWDWAFISSLYFQDLNVITALLNKMYQYYKDNIVGIQYSSNDDAVVKHFIECGFVKNGEITDYPKDKTKSDLINTELKKVDLIEDYEYILSNEVIKEYSTIMDDMTKINQSTQTDLQFVALHQDTFAGGVYGYLKNDYLYVSLLIVSDDFRNLGIASKLMDLIEEEAIKQGYNNFYLDTCEFQALGFYLKRNYEIAATIKEFPKGFDEYMLVKKLVK